MKPVIKEGGTSRIFDKIKTLETPLQSSGSCIWVPEAKTNLTTKNISENGVYVAKNDGAYGYSSVIVNVQTVGGITGTGSDGKQHTISTDPSGNVVDNVTPVEIRITAGPSYTGPYGVGAYISFDGLVVHAYDSSGADMGAVPFNELTFPVTVADYSESRPVEYGATYDNTSALHNPDYFSQPLSYVESGMFSFSTVRDGDPDLGASVERKLTAPGGVICIEFTCETANSVGATVLFLSLTSGKTVENKWRYGTWDYYVIDNISLDNMAVTVGGTTVYYNYISTNLTENDELSTTLPQNQYTGQGYSDVTGGNGVQDVATIVFDGNSEIIGGGQTIPVNWQRPGDGLVLETSFGISVVPPPSGTND